MAAGSDETPEPKQHRGRVVHVEQQQPGEDEVEGSAGHGGAGLEVERLEAAAVVAGLMEHLERLCAERCVDVDAGDLARRPDALGHQAHRLAGPAADVEAAVAGTEPDGVEEPGGLGLPHPRLRLQSLVLLG